MKRFNLQLFAEAVSGKKIVYLLRILSKAATANGEVLAFVTENERSKSKDADITITKDGMIRTPSDSETEITFTALLAKDDSTIDDLEDAMDNNEIVECWEANLEEPAGEGDNKFKGMYFQGYLTEVTKSSNAEDFVEVSLTYAANGSGVRGDVTVSADQQEAASYVFTDTQKTGA